MHNIKIDPKKLFKELLKINKILKPFSVRVWQLVNDIGKKNKKILFEGAQGSMLDIDFGTYPYVTSSNTTAGQIFAGTGLGSKFNHKVIGIVKAYTTRVGSGPFPTEQSNNIGKYLIDKGKEFGTVTKRERRCGWFDAILVKQSVTINGVDNIVLTKLDVLDNLQEIKICIGYFIGNKKYNFLPFSESLQQKIVPIYKTLAGWGSSTYGLKKWSELPMEAKNYINVIEKLIGKNISVISTGPERTQTINKKNIL